jgi:hypothetical protein
MKRYAGVMSPRDPTAVVGPKRLERRLLDLMPQELSAHARLLHASPSLNEWLQRWDAAYAPLCRKLARIVPRAAD